MIYFAWLLPQKIYLSWVLDITAWNIQKNCRIRFGNFSVFQSHWTTSAVFLDMHPHFYPTKYQHRFLTWDKFIWKKSKPTVVTHTVWLRNAVNLLVPNLDNWLHICASSILTYCTDRGERAVNKTCRFKRKAKCFHWAMRRIVHKMEWSQCWGNKIVVQIIWLCQYIKC